MKSLTKKISSAFLLSFIFAAQTFASGGDFFREGEQPKGTAGGTLGGNISTIINYFLGLLGLVAVGFLIYAGVLMVTAGGSDEQVTKARKIIMYAVIGIVIILLSYTIITFVTSAL